MKKILLIIPTYNASNHIARCLRHIKKSLEATGDFEFKTDVLVVDDCSTDNTVKVILDEGLCRVITGTGDLWWSGSINRGVKTACNENYDYALLMNSDNFIPEDYFKTLYECLSQLPLAIIGSTVFNENGTPFFLGCNVNSWGQFEYIKKLEEPFVKCDAFGGMGVAVPIDVFKQVGFFDEKKLPHYFGDTDFWVRCKKNKQPLFICKDLKIFVDAKNTGAKAKGNKVLFFLKNLTNRKFHANVVAVSRFYLNNYKWIGFPFFVALFYINYILASSKKSFTNG